MKENIKEYLSYVIIILVVILIRTFLVTPARVNGESMENTLYNGEIVLLNKIGLKTKGLNRFDIVVFKYNDELLIKRVIGLPGEKVSYKDNKLYINDELIEADFEKTNDFEGYAKEDEYFVLGDNRDNSKDSRYFGSVPFKELKGKVSFILFPFKRFGKIE